MGGEKGRGKEVGGQERERERELPCCEEQDFKEKREDMRRNLRTHCCLPCKATFLLFFKRLLMERFYLLSNWFLDVGIGLAFFSMWHPY